MERERKRESERERASERERVPEKGQLLAWLLAACLVTTTFLALVWVAGAGLA